MAGRGTLRIYLGAAPGVGKTFAMLDEGWRRHERGTDVVIGYVETHGRAKTLAQVRDLEIVPRRVLEHRGVALEEMDVDAVLARRPRVALVDELAHTNVPGSKHEKRWQDVDALLEAGIDVVSTVNIQHLESLNDVVARITGVVQKETVPDRFVRSADQIELVDMSPEALRRRMAHGNIYPSERIDAALANYFRPGNLGALRELALLWVADRVEENLQQYLADHGITDTWETRERVVVAVTGAPSGRMLIRRAARMAGRARGDLVGVHAVPADGLARGADQAELVEQRRLIVELGGTYHEIVGDDPAQAVADFARAEQATQLVLGASPARGWKRLTHGTIVNRVLARATGIDVHVIATDAVGPMPPVARRVASPLPRQRRIAAWVLLPLSLLLLTLALEPHHENLALTTVTLAFLAAVVAVAAIGGLLPGLVASLVASLLVNWFFTPPVRTFTIADPENVVSLAVFVTVAVLVSVLVDRSARRSRDANRARAEAEALARATADLATQVDPLPHLLDEIRVTFGQEAAAVLARDGDSWLPIAASGLPVPRTPADGDAFPLQAAASDHDPGSVQLVLAGPALAADDQRVLRTLARQIAVALEARELAQHAAEAEVLAEADAVRTALLRAVSHDLRTPLAAIKAYVSGLRQPDVDWTREEVADALAAVDAECDRLNRVVSNLLDASRLQVGALAVSLRPTAVEEVVASALGDRELADVKVELADDLPLVVTDPTLLERALANVLVNAVRHAGDAAAPVRLEAQRVGHEVHVRVVDRGPGIPEDERHLMFQPFQRLGDQDTADGVGLGLAITRGFLDAVGASLSLDDTPGGGLTVTIALLVLSEAAS
jgi:two-component system sensor histidine kinase KdpD